MLGSLQGPNQHIKGLQRKSLNQLLRLRVINSRTELVVWEDPEPQQERFFLFLCNRKRSHRAEGGKGEVRKRPSVKQRSTAKWLASQNMED